MYIRIKFKFEHMDCLEDKIFNVVLVDWYIYVFFQYKRVIL
jgi:hypothetical protein